MKPRQRVWNKSWTDGTGAWRGARTDGQTDGQTGVQDYVPIMYQELLILFLPSSPTIFFQPRHIISFPWASSLFSVWGHQAWRLSLQLPQSLISWNNRTFQNDLTCECQSHFARIGQNSLPHKDQRDLGGVINPQMWHCLGLLIDMQWPLFTLH